MLVALSFFSQMKDRTFDGLFEFWGEIVEGKCIPRGWPSATYVGSIKNREI